MSVCVSVPLCVIVNYAQTERVTVFCCKKIVIIFHFIDFNLKGHLNCINGLKVTVVLMSVYIHNYSEHLFNTIYNAMVPFYIYNFCERGMTTIYKGGKQN